MKMNHCIAILCSAACLCAAAAPKPGDVIFSDNFDAAPLGLNQTSLPAGWTVTGGTIDVLGPPGFDPRPDNGHYIDMQGSAGHPGRLSIDIPVETSGIYLVEFEWAGNPRGNSGAITVDTGPTPFSDGKSTIFGVTSDISFLDGANGTGIQGQGFFLLSFYTPAFIVLPDGERVFPDTGLLLDNVSVTFVQSIPEPATFALTLIGIVPLALAMRRRRRMEAALTGQG